MNNLNQSLTLSLIDKYTAPARRIASVGDDLASKLGAGQKEISRLNQQAKSVSGLQSLEQRLSGTSSKLGEAKREVGYLRRQMELAGPGAKTFARDLDKAKSNVLRLAESERQLKTETAAAHNKLRAAGIDTRNLAGEHDRLKRSIGGTVSEMQNLATVSAKVDVAQARYDKTLQRGANMTIAAAGIHQVGTGIMGALSSPLQQMRGVEQAKGELQSVGIEDTAAVIERGRAISSQFAGIDTAAFTRAAYDIKSGIDTLSDKGVANMTAAAAITAKATKAEVGQMTSLFATGYGTFKKTLFADLSDDEFGQRFSASLAASVKQFKTTGAGMQQAIQSMGGGLAASSVPLAEQLAGLGMLQQSMEAGVAGTTLKALERTAAVAQERFTDMGVSINTLDENGNLRSLPDLLEEMQNTFGKNYSTEIGAMIQQAFGSDEAMPFFKQLWGQQDTFRASAAALEEAANQGERFTASMAKRLDDNWDARLTVIGQRWDNVMEGLGYKLVPVLERVIPAVEWVVDAIGNFIEKNPGLTTGLLGLAGIVGGLALIAAPVIVTVAALGTTLSWLGLQAAKANAAAAMGGLGGGMGGGKGRGMKGLGGKLGVASVLTVGAMSIGSTLMDDSQSGTDKAASISKDVGTLGGGLIGAAKGAALGAAIGSVVPVLGTAVGGLIGSIVGGIGGSMAGGWMGEKVGDGIKSVFGEDDVAGDTPSGQVQRAVAASRDVGVRGPAPVHHEDKRQYTLQIAQQPGEDPESFARRIMDMLHRQDAASMRSALYDPL